MSSKTFYNERQQSDGETSNISILLNNKKLLLIIVAKRSSAFLSKDSTTCNWAVWFEKCSQSSQSETFWHFKKSRHFFFSDSVSFPFKYSLQKSLFSAVSKSTPQHYCKYWMLVSIELAAPLTKNICYLTSGSKTLLMCQFVCRRTYEYNRWSEHQAAS